MSNVKLSHPLFDQVNFQTRSQSCLHWQTIQSSESKLRNAVCLHRPRFAVGRTRWKREL